MAAVAAAACAARVAQPPAAPAPDASGAALVVTLVWDAPVDLDLYVTDPAWRTAYYARPDGHLRADVRCPVTGASVRSERAEWTHPLPGRYRVGVDFPDACGTAIDHVSYRIVVDRAGRREETTGSVRLEERLPAAAEFAVP
jgi:uncharacterized protein YfaP (DUF2135 family)